MPNCAHPASWSSGPAAHAARTPRRGRARHRLAAVVAALALALSFGVVTAPATSAAVLFGNDISWPQCTVADGGAGQPMPPTSTQFVVVGLTHGLPFTENPCVADQLQWVRDHAKPAHAYTMAGFPTTAQLATYGSQGPWATSTRAGRLSNVGYAEAGYAASTLSRIGWHPPVVWIDVEPRPAQPWPSATWAQRVENRYVVEGLMRGLRDRGYAYGVYSNSSGWQAITGSWLLPGVPVWATAGTLDYPSEALDRCTQPSFSGGHVYLSQWWNATTDFDRTCEPYGFTALPVAASTLTASTGDVDGDWRTDVLARWTTGVLKLYSGTGTGSLSLGRQIGTGWGGMDALDTAGDLDGNGTLDVIARERVTGDLWLYRGDGRGGWTLPRLRIGTGWGGMSAIVGPGDLTGDGRPDLLARRASDGTAWVYPGTGHATWQPRIQVASGWNRYDRIVPVGDVTGDGRPDVMAREPSTGRLWLLAGTGAGGFAAPVLVGTGWNGMTALASPGDFDGDRVGDVLARDGAGVLWLYPRTASGGWSPRRQVSTGWNVVDAIF
ncbi:FG-GAP-like repeat-containing protein [Intrasporangium flavum]|uniref:FG-GAP-like repeat-containing protein n=1 Tax=Intrasporangium flavum TaxID=1428657 RepID=UPI0009F82124|nr:FG-GAP-like repeat-containing protein [Intrasporangium flavum]